ncbi:phage protein NinX family protein [Burkholderia gladioli]|nr:phage protein NinX family protein [Burkholderia gladioli]
MSLVTVLSISFMAGLRSKLGLERGAARMPARRRPGGYGRCCARKVSTPEPAMRIDRLDARELDYWTARALARDDLPLIFVAVEPDIVVTVASGGFRRMDSRFSPAAEWADAAVVLERVVELRSTRVGEARASVTASFAGDGTAATHDAHGEGENLRHALLRAFIRARFGDTVEPVPTEPHAVNNGRVTPHRAGAPLPRDGERRDAPHDPNEIGALPRP